MNNKYNKIYKLVDYLNKHTILYNNNQEIISDSEWDKSYFELVELEKETGLILGNSPTQTINYEIKDKLEKKTHNHKMLSLEKTKSIKEVSNFIGNKLFLAMSKMDGLTCSLMYKNGELISAETRGNGVVGEDILHNIKTLSSVPHHIPYNDELIIDGEIICTFDNFEKFSNEYKNPRNFASGSIRLLDAEECSKRGLTFVCWDIITQIYSEDGIEYQLSQKLNMLSQYGFTVVPYELSNGSFLVENEYQAIIDILQQESKNRSYPIDGIVFKFNDCEYGRSLGETSHHFKNALAYKFFDENYPSTLLDIEWTMGRTGILTPIAVFEPIDIEGSTVSRASLHNISIMNDLSGGFERVGDIVYIYKANQIIPQISEWEHIEDNEGKHLAIPEVCPICGEPTKIKMDNNSKVLICSNPLCSGKLINRLDHFCGKKGLDIKGISKATLEKLIDWGWLNNYTDLFKLSNYRNEWIKKAGFGVKSVDKILNAINEARTCEVSNFISALGIPLIGSTASKDLTKIFNWENFRQAIDTKYHFDTIANFGAEMNYSLHKFDYQEADELVKNYISFKEKEENSDTPEEKDLKGMVFVVTGKLTYFRSRDALKARIESLGGKVTGSVSKNTNYLINNDKNSTSSKNKTAEALGIPVLSEEEFIEIFNIIS